MAPSWRTGGLSYFQVYNSVAFHAFTRLCIHHCYLVSEQFYHHKRKLIPIKAATPSYSPSPSPGNPVCFLHHISFVLGLLLILFLLPPPQSSETSQTGEPPGPSGSLARVVMYGCAGCSLHNSVWSSWSLGSFDGAEAESGVSRSWRRGARGGEPDLEGCTARPHPPQPPAHPQVQSLPYKRSGIPAGIECGVGVQR